MSRPCRAASHTCKRCKMKGRWACLLRNRGSQLGRVAGEERRDGRLGQVLSVSSWRGTWVLFMSKGLRGPRGLFGGGPKQGQKFYIKNCSGCCPENVPVPGQRWAPLWSWGGKAQGGHVPSCGFTVLATGSGWGGGFPRWPDIGPGYVVVTGA